MGDDPLCRPTGGSTGAAHRGHHRYHLDWFGLGLLDSGGVEEIDPNALHYVHDDYPQLADIIWKHPSPENALEGDPYIHLRSRYRPRKRTASAGHPPSLGHRGLGPDAHRQPGPPRPHTGHRLHPLRARRHVQLLQHPAGRVYGQRRIAVPGGCREPPGCLDR